MAPLDGPAFDLDGRPFSLKVVLAAGLASGRLTRTVQKLAESIALDAYLDATGQRLRGPVLTPRLDAWRKLHRLTSADTTERWLAAHDAVLGDLASHVARMMAHDIAKDHVAEALMPEPKEVMRLLPKHLLFEDELEPLVLDVAMRAVAEPPPRPSELAAIDVDFSGLDLTDEQRAEVIAIESRFRLADAVVCSQEAMAAELDKRLGQVEYATASFPRENVALEVVATLRDDPQLGLARLAEKLKAPHERVRVQLEDLGGTAISAQLATGRPGDVIGPEKIEGAFRVYEVLARHEPSLADPEVERRITLRLRQRAYGSQIERRVRLRLFGR